MRKRLLITSVAALSLFCTTVVAQNGDKCGSTEAERIYIQNNPDKVPAIKQANQQLEEHTKQFALENETGIRGTVYTIPVVFHILHNNGPENISDAQVMSAMKLLNDDFRKLNADLSEVASSFQSITGDVEFHFRLAKLDPSGNCTTGIVRWQTSETYSGDDGIKAGKIWPRDKYLNVFVVSSISLGPNILGYTYRPATVNGNPGIDAILVKHAYLGTIGTAASNTSRTLTHEVGHWFNLLHTWGSTNSPGVGSNCNDDDLVSDTPNTVGQAGGCNLNSSSCSSLDNVQNYMNYAACTRMFTNGQATRMRGSATSSTAQRNNLWTSATLQATGLEGNGTICTVDFASDLLGVCAGTSVTYYDISSGTHDQWDWTTYGGVPGTSTAEYPVTTYYGGGLFKTRLIISNGSNSGTEIKDGYMPVYPIPGNYIPMTESFENENNGATYWTTNNPDGSGNKWMIETSTGYTGSKCLKMKNHFNVDGEIDEVMGTTYDLSTLTSATMTFKAAYAKRFSNNSDLLFLFGSTNCGQSWTFMSSWTAAILETTSPTNPEWTPSSTSEWQEFSVSISSSMLKENFRPMFRLIAGGGNNLYIDDINITGTFNSVPVLNWPPNATQNTADNLTVDWKAVGYVDEYEYQIDQTPAFNSGNLISGTKAYISTNPGNSDTEHALSGLNWGTTYYWRVRTVTNSTPSSWSTAWNFKVSNNGVGFADEEAELLDFKVYPNPMENNSIIAFNLPNASQVILTIYDMLGKQVEILASNNMSAGTYNYAISNKQLDKGLYMLRIIVNNKAQTLKLVVK